MTLQVGLCRPWSETPKTSFLASQLIYSDEHWTLDCEIEISNTTHYENMPMQYTEILFISKNSNFYWKKFDFFKKYFAQNIDCGYTLKPPP